MEPCFANQSTYWTPSLYTWQKDEGSNVLNYNIIRMQRGILIFGDEKQSCHEISFANNLNNQNSKVEADLDK